MKRSNIYLDSFFPAFADAARRQLSRRSRLLLPCSLVAILLCLDAYLLAARAVLVLVIVGMLRRHSILLAHR